MKTSRTKILFTGFAPNLTGKHVLISLGFLFFPWLWGKLRKGKYTAQAEQQLSTYLQSDVVLTDSGRSALYVALKALGVGEGDEVIVQAFTCIVVINAIKWTGATPVYVDIDESYNVHAEKIEQLITPKTKAIIAQHTFGTPANIREIQRIAKQHNIALVEDCAHALGVKTDGQMLGTFGDISMFSFGSDKVVSCVRGGAIATKNETTYKKCVELVEHLPHMPLMEVIRHLFHSIFFWIGKKIYKIKIGKMLLYTARKLRISSSIIDACEKRGEKPVCYPAKLPNALARILTIELSRVDAVNQHRKNIAKLYSAGLNNAHISKPQHSDESIYLRYPVRVTRPNHFIAQAKKQNIILGDWYQVIAAPKDADQSRINYTKDSCPDAQRATQEITNLPTNRHISERDAERIIQFCNNYVES